MKLTHDVRIDKDTVCTTTLTVENGWMRLDHVSADEYVGGSSLRLAHVVRVEKQPQRLADGETYFWITLTDRDANKATIPFALTEAEVGQLDDAIVAA